MSRITNCICDGCGKEIIENPVQIFANKMDLKQDTFVKEMYYFPEKDFCEDCMKKITDYIENFSRQNVQPLHSNGVKRKEPLVAAPDQQKEQQKEPALFNIRDLIKQGKTVEEIVELTGCKKQSVYTARNYLKQLQQKKEKELEQRPDKKPRKCSEVRKNCMYSKKVGSQEICDYLDMNGHSRGCSPEQCTVYEKKKKA